MVLAPVSDFFDGVLAVLTGLNFYLVANINFPIIILLEATLLRRLMPGAKGFRDALVMNITTFLMGAGSGFLLEEPINFLADNLPEWTWIPLLLLAILATMGLTVLLEGGILKFLEPKFPSSRIWRTALIVNIASYVVLGVSVGLVAWGYAYQDSRGGSIGLVYLLTQCGVPLASIALLIGLLFENFISAYSKSKPMVTDQEEEDEEGRVSVHGPLEGQEMEIISTIKKDSEKRTSEPERKPIVDTVKHRQDGWGFYAYWILATAIGAGMGFGVSGAVIVKLKSLGGIIWSVLLLGVGIGGMQWLLLRRYIKNAGWWVLATLGGWIVALATVARSSVLLDFTPDGLVAEGNIAVIVLGILMVSLILGIVTGTLQWLVIRKQVYKSILWILISSFGWVLSIISGSFVGLSLYYLLQEYANRFSAHVDINPTALIIWPVILAGVATGITAGAITGTALVRLLQPSTLVDVPELGERIITF